MLAYKAFPPNLTCRGYQFRKGVVNITKYANCVQNGFHCAENPLDCLSYYPDWDRSVYYLVEAAGDLDEDGKDSKISCTHLTLIEQLDLRAFIEESCKYIIRHPGRRYSERSGKITVACTAGTAMEGGAVIVRGKQPMARGKKGAVLAVLQEGKESPRIQFAKMMIIDGIQYPEDTWFTLENGKAVEA